MMSSWQYAIIGVLGFVTWNLLTYTYNIFFHPLRSFPGPLSARASRLPWGLANISARERTYRARIHDEYGPVVRIAPNHLSFTDPSAWKTIYGHRAQGAAGGKNSGPPEMPKLRIFVESICGLPDNIISAPYHEHQRLRKALAPGFSDGALREQEPMILELVDRLMEQLHDRQRSGGSDGSSSSSGCEKVGGPGEKEAGENMTAWYNWATFDIMGRLVFGQSFGCVEEARYHPWILWILRMTPLVSVFMDMSYLGLDGLLQILFRLGGLLTVSESIKFTEQMVRKRLEMKAPDDLFEGLVQKREEWNLSFEHLSGNASVLALAGSETTATALCAATYYVLKHPDVHDKVKAEVRSSFVSKNDMNITSVNQLPYTIAVLNESMRLCPPLTSGIVRVVPQGGEYIAGRFVPEGTFVECHIWSMNHSKECWVEPYKFRPERWLRDINGELEPGNRHEAFQIFSYGPRNCIGRNLAYAEMRLIFARLMYEFDMKLADDSEDWMARQKAYRLWVRSELNVRFTQVSQAGSRHSACSWASQNECSEDTE